MISENDGSMKRFAVTLLVVELITLGLTGGLATYGVNMNDIQYVFYTNVCIMMLIGFGYLMTFLRKFGLGAVAFTMLLTVLSVQIHVLAGPLFSMLASGNWTKVSIDSLSLSEANFCAGALLISLGAYIGKASAEQMLIIAVVEVIMYAFNTEYLNEGIIKTADMGGTIFIHLFGAYFGLGVAWMLGPPKNRVEDSAASTISDVFSLIGTAFLWIYWPSFNGAAAPVGQPQQLRTSINTVLALCGSTAAAFVWSVLFNSHSKIRPADIQNATLAGGVAIGASSNLVVTPGGAMGIGLIAGSISAFGFNRVQSWLDDRSLHDTCGVHNLHGMPAVFGVCVVAVVCSQTRPEDFSPGEYASMFPLGAKQWSGQLLGGLATLGISLVSGLITGKFVSSECFSSPERANFNDNVEWEVANDYDNFDNKLEEE
jgi:ammonium transporter Rh